MRIDGRQLDRAQRSAMDALADPAGSDVYLWGPPGRGKSWLVDAHLASMSRKRVLRSHFHEFFADVHRLIRTRGSLADALDALLTGLDVVCFDEFHVHDPADGQYVTALLDAIGTRRIRLIVTSNYPPAGLMPNPLFHSMFEPTIDLIERRFRIVECDGGVDYRASRADRAPGAWLCPGTHAQLRSVGLRRPAAAERTTVSPAGHPIVATRARAGEIWFRFADLCATATAPIDYLALADEYRRWVITDVPDQLDAEPAQRFANLVDVLWEKRTEVIVAASNTPDSLESAGAHDLDRMRSRLRQLPMA
ncbi:cell division protein ZapE [Gordonia sp. TBRC 11910]|uniref:Cell division protein ZapE n=1 Tax=Gordonia asplenii TaxID=2725283 RepID=A0A848KUE1_9ACTN|nr:cell division protein ZapE [Gordonia asplenii]NMN99800.1 cell division protein ZapE [Gordonia asplenii]